MSAHDRRALIRPIVITLAVLVWLVPGAASARSTTLFSLDDPRLDEASGIARGITSPGVFYVQNDSGDSARFFALDARTGRVLAVYSVPGAQNHDWEDIAVAPDRRGVASVWLADIGDNDAVRAEVQLYRVDEPRVELTRRNLSRRTAAPDVWRLRYPAGPVNAESLAVSPQGRAYLVTKSDSGRSAVFAVPSRADANRVQVLSRIAGITFHAHPSLIPSRLQVLATGASLAADGAEFVVRTYTDAYVWRIRGGDLAGALRTAGTDLALPLQPQGEGVCLVGDTLVLDSEQVGSPVDEVTLPSARSSSSPAASTTAPSLSEHTKPHSAERQHGDPRVPIAVGALVIAVAGAVVFVTRRRRPPG